MADRNRAKPKKPAASAGSKAGRSKPAASAGSKAGRSKAAASAGSKAGRSKPAGSADTQSKAGGAGSSRSGSSNGRGGLSAAEAVTRARESLTELLGRPVESVLGIDRESANWITTVQVLELARIPNTTDVLGEYEAVLDRRGELVSYKRTRRYHRGQVDGGGQ